MVKNTPASAGVLRDMGLIPGEGRSVGGHGSPLQCSCLENPMDRSCGLQSMKAQRVERDRRALAYKHRGKSRSLTKARISSNLYIKHLSLDSCCV